MEEDEDFSDDRYTYDESLEEEDVNYEAAKDLREDRWQGIRATCMR